MPIKFLKPGVHKVQPLMLSSDYPPNFYLSRDEIKEHEINAGDNVVMVGRFVDNERPLHNCVNILCLMREISK